MATPASALIPPDTPPQLGEVDKIILQDMLAERAKLRDGIPDVVRYAGIVLVAMIVFAVNAPFPTQPTAPGQPLWFWKR